MPAPIWSKETLAEFKTHQISSAPGSVPLKPGEGPLPYGGTANNGTSGKSVFGKRKIVAGDNDPNPRALMLNFPPEPSAEALAGWVKNYKSSIPNSTGKGDFMTTSQSQFGVPSYRESDLAARNYSHGDLRQQAFTRPQPQISYYPPAREGEASQEDASYEWSWPERPVRTNPPQLPKAERHESSFIEEYNLRPPWLKY
mmetsp:Transcript_7610/g.22685  ORF Transcript_7610/g.22685 Transcript_7610/m.22685 type:complete len:199 (-) Transcript_7610:346-942(-)